MQRKRLIASIATACAAAALTAGIAEGSGTTQGSSTQTSSASTTSGPPWHGAPGRMPGADGGPRGQAVHSVGVVLNKAKTAYVTETSDQGTIESVDSGGGTVTIVEGTKSVPYKTVTVSVPSEASISLDGKASTLSALVKGDRVSVSSSSDGTAVMAMDSSFRPEGGPGHGGAKEQMPPGEGSSSGASSSSGSSSSSATTSG